jgi:hypothetical protein
MNRHLTTAYHGHVEKRFYGVWSSLKSIFQKPQESHIEIPIEPQAKIETPVLEKVNRPRVCIMSSKLLPLLPEIESKEFEDIEKASQSKLNQALLAYRSDTEKRINAFKEELARAKSVENSEHDSLKEETPPWKLPPNVISAPRPDIPRKPVPKELESMPNDRSVWSKLIPFEKIQSMKRQAAISMLSDQAKSYIDTKEKFEEAIQDIVNQPPISWQATPEEMLYEKDILVRTWHKALRSVEQENMPEIKRLNIRLGTTGKQRQDDHALSTIPIS